MPSLSNLPIEIQLQILAHLTNKNKQSVRGTSKGAKKTVNSHYRKKLNRGGNFNLKSSVGPLTKENKKLIRNVGTYNRLMQLSNNVRNKSKVGWSRPLQRTIKSLPPNSRIHARSANTTHRKLSKIHQ